MSEHCGYIVQVAHLRQHSNADRLQILTVFGNDTCVDMNVHMGDKGIYFPTDLQLSVEFCEQNNLVRKKDENGNNIGGYMDPAKRNVTTIRLRGEKSDGLYLPLRCLEYTGIDMSTLTVGTQISVVNGHEICQKYIPPVKAGSHTVKRGNRVRKKRVPRAPLFQEHADTEQLAYNLDQFHINDQIEITLKMHGTSQRTGYLPVFKGYKRTFWDWLLRRDGTPIYDWDYVTGTRRTVLEDYTAGFYGSNLFRREHAKFFEGKLHKGETVYYEVVGFTETGSPIMPTVDNKRTNDKQFIKYYGEKTTFSYGCEPTGKTKEYFRDDIGTYSLEKDAPQSDFYVYRMTMTNEDGNVVEYTPDYMRYRCEQMGAKCVPLLCKAIIDAEGIHAYEPPSQLYTYVHETGNMGETVQKLAELYYDGPDPIGKTHVREGVVIRIVNRPTFTAFKHKNFYFKCLEGIVKSNADAPDMEEMQEVVEEENE